jgi:site-specific DNA recombinase
VKKESIENYVLDELQNTLFSENSIKRLASMLSEYSVKMKDKSQKELKGALCQLDEIKAKIDRIIQLVADSGISIDTVKGELKRLEERKLAVEGYIHEMRMKGNSAAVSEEMIVGMINKSKELVRVSNIPECRSIIGNYVESVIVYRDKVEIKFKIAVPDKDNSALCPLKIERDLEALKEKYQKTG